MALGLRGLIRLGKTIDATSASSLRYLSASTNVSSSLCGNRRWYATRCEQLESQLPRLPIPKIEDTCDRYLKVVEPLAENLEEVKATVEKFLKEDAPVLQDELRKLDDENEKGSWLSGFWETMYLEYRAPQPINTNPFFVMDQFPNGKDQVQVLAASIRSIASYYFRVETDAVPPATGPRGVPLCAYQDKRLLASARIPAAGRDSFQTHEGSTHVILNIAGHLFAFHVLTPDGQLISQELCEKAIKKSLKDMMEKTMTSNHNAMIPLFTALDRDSWANARMLLEVENEDALKTIDSAIAVFNLCDLDPKNLEDASRMALVNTFGWFDKLQCIVLRNGQVCFNMEHTATDGHAILALLDNLRADMTGSGGNALSAVEDKSFTKHAKPMYIEWSLVPELEELMEKSQEEFGNLASSVNSSLIDFKQFGSDWIKGAKISPDAFVQMAFQLAYHRLFHKVGSTYESVMMKHFLRGRTETGRPLTNEMKEFVETMGNMGASLEEKEKILRTTAEAHVNQISECQAGKGVDRHLWALKNLASLRQKRLDDYSIPSLFNDQTFQDASNIILSTSTCATKGISSFGFGPVSPDGFGLGYSSEPERLMVFVTAFTEQGPEMASLFASHVEKAFIDMKAVLVETSSD